MSSNESNSSSSWKKGSLGKLRGVAIAAEEQERLLGLSVTPPPPDQEKTARARTLRMGNQSEVCLSPKHGLLEL